MSGFLAVLTSRRGFQPFVIPPEEPAAVASVTVTGPTSVAVGSVAQLVATVKDAVGNVLADRTVTWSSDSAHASVDGTGLVFGDSAGTAGITATCEGTASAPYTVAVTETSLTAGTATATPGDGQVSLSATAPTGGTAPYTYQWYRSTASGTKGSAIDGATSRSYVDTGLTNGTAYYYTLTATDAVGASVDYIQKSATPAAVTIVLTPVVAPAALTIPSDGVMRIQVDLARVNASTGKLAAKLLFSDQKQYEDMALHTITASSSDEAVATAVVDSLGVIDRGASVIVTARGDGTATISINYDDGTYAGSMEITVDSTVPAAPSGLAAGTVSGLNVPFTWSAWTDSAGDFEHFRLYYETDGSDPTTASRSLMLSRGSSAATSGTARLSLPSALHKVAVAAVDKAGHVGALSNVVSVTTGAAEASNEPAGYTTIFNNDGTTMPPGIATDDYLLVVSDPDSPTGSAVEWRWYNDDRDGNALWDDRPGTRTAYFLHSNNGVGDPAKSDMVSEAYFRFRLKHNVAWIHHPGDDKLSYFGQSTKSSSMFPTLHASVPFHLAPFGMGFQVQTKVGGAFAFALLNSNTQWLYPGGYHVYEVKLIAQSGDLDAGTGEYVADGAVQIWVDSVLVFNKTDVQWVSSGDLGFKGFEWEPFWGGSNEDSAGTDPVSFRRYFKHSMAYFPVGAFDWCRFAEFYMSGKV